MNRSMLRPLAVAAALALSLPAQQRPAAAGGAATEAIAAAIVRAQAPAVDDPDAIARDLLTTALQHRRSPAAWYPVQEVIWFVGQLQDPAALRAMLPTENAGERQHGRLAQKLVELRWWLDRAVDGPARRGYLPPLGYCRHAVVVGPFGDDGEHFVGVPFAPEFRFPALDTEVPGRGMPARVRRVETRPGSDYVEFQPRNRPAPGCYYALHRFAVAADTDAYLEVEFDGDWQVFVDGAEIHRVERWRATAPRRHYLGLHLPAGEHTVLLKTASFERNVYTLRWLDADGVPAGAVQHLESPDPAAPATAAARPLDARYVTADDLFLRAAEPTGADPSLRIAGLLLAIRENDHDLALRHAEPLQKAPPADAATALAFAKVLRWAPLPDELRKATARKIEETATATLPATHYAALTAKVQLLDEQDKREQALRLLEQNAAAGPGTFQRRFGLLRDLKFTAEEAPLLDQWAAKCPRDPRPLLAMADAANAVGDGKRAHELRRRAWTVHRDLQNGLPAAIRGAIDVGDLDQAKAWLDDLDPEPANPRQDLNRLQIEASLARARGDTKVQLERLQQMAAHADANDTMLLDVAGQLTRLGERDAVITCLQQSLARNPDQPVARAWLANLGAGSPDDATFARFRRDGDAARAAFTAGEREQAASATVLIDQRIVELRADGSWTSESHELRRINDQAGVEEYRTADALSGADEVLLVRTIGTDGKAWIPGRVENAYAMQRLEPGAFVEWRHRERGGAPGAETAGAGQFLFGSETEPMVVSELIVIRPKDAPRGELRTRSLGEPTETVDLGDGRTATVFRRENVAALPRENFLPTLQELVPVAEIGEDDAPFSRLRRIRVAIGARTKVTAPIAAQAAALANGVTGDRALVETIHAWCQTEIEDGPADNALDTLLRKKGNRFLLEVALLRAAKLDVVTLACAEQRPELTESGDTLFLGQGQFDVPGARVTLANGERLHLFVDAPRHWPLGVVPAPRAGSRAVVLHDDRTETIVLPGNGDAVQTIRVRGEATVEGNELRIEATGEIGDLAGFGIAERLRELKENQQKVVARQIAQQMFAGFRVKSAQLGDPTPGKPLTIKASLTRAVQAKGQGVVMPLPLSPINYVKNFGDRAERTLPYHFPGELLSDWQIDVDPGQDLRFVDCPAPVAIDLGPLSHELQCQRIGNRLRFVRLSRIAPATLPASRFGEWLRVLADGDRADQLSIELTGKGS